jgi:hypothetical protein
MPSNEANGAEKHTDVFSTPEIVQAEKVLELASKIRPECLGYVVKLTMEAAANKTRMRGAAVLMSSNLKLVKNIGTLAEKDAA